jgi:hypothetical protein
VGICKENRRPAREVPLHRCAVVTAVKPLVADVVTTASYENRSELGEFR